MKGDVRAVLQGGLLAAVLDIAAAFLVYGLRGAPPLRILQSIASGLLGREAFEGGLATAALGGMLHFLIAIGWAVVYCVASRSLAVLRRRPLLSGAAFGAAVYFLMNLVVLPLSAFPSRPFDLDIVILGVHVAFVGIPISLSVSRSAKKA
jgi:uncharacterized membrane protein YagU involved in acid resistance